MSRPAMGVRELADTIRGRGGLVEPGDLEGRAGAWRFRIRPGAGEIDFGLARTFDRWANSRDLSARIPRDERRLMALFCWLIEKGTGEADQGFGAGRFICQREATRAYRRKPPPDLTPRR